MVPFSNSAESAPQRFLVGGGSVASHKSGMPMSAQNKAMRSVLGMSV